MNNVTIGVTDELNIWVLVKEHYGYIFRNPDQGFGFSGHFPTLVQAIDSFLSIGGKYAKIIKVNASFRGVTIS